MNVFEYRKAEKKADNLLDFLLELDSAANMLYNRLEYPEVWTLVKHLEGVRIKYYIEFEELNNLLKDKETLNVKKED